LLPASESSATGAMPFIIFKNTFITKIVVVITMILMH
jgi:hypothetical protein